MEQALNHKVNRLQCAPRKYTLKPTLENMQGKPSMNNYFRKMSKIPKSMKIFFIILYLIFGYDFGFSKLFKKKIAKLFKCYSVVLTTATFVSLMLYLKEIGSNPWLYLYSIHYVGNFCILKCAKYTVYNLLSDIHAAEQIADLEKKNLGYITTAYALATVIPTGIVLTFRLVFANEQFEPLRKMHPLIIVLYVICYFGVDLYIEAEIIIYYYMYSYVKNMKKSLEQDKDVNKFITSYNKIADYYNKIRRLCDNIVSTF